MRIITLILGLMIFSSCSENIYDEIADKDTPEAIYFEAKTEINNRNYSAAITLLASLDATFLSDRERIPVHASAFAGRCGLEFLTLLNNLQGSGSGTIFLTLMAAFPGATSSGSGGVDDCIQAETIVEAIGDAATRDGDENLFMAFINLSKIGTILSSLADNVDSDGVADPGFDQCDNADFPDAMVRELGAGLAVTIQSLTAIGASYIDASLNEVTALCAQNVGGVNLSNFCTETDPANFSPLEVQALRYVIGSNDLGIDSCGNRDATNCAIANPACP